MKKGLLILVALFFVGCKSKEVVPAAFVEPIWHTNMNEATEIALKQKKPLLLFFTGSDWCGWCIRLQKEVLLEREFKEWASKNVVLVELDFPRRTQQDQAIITQNQQLQSLFAVRGYPTIWFAIPEQKETKMNLKGIGSTGYVAGGPSKWLEGANAILQAKN